MFNKLKIADQMFISVTPFDANQVLWTDYPFQELGDQPGEIAKIRQITVIQYDGDKYCDIIVKGIKSNIKAGYIYTEKGRCGQVQAFDPDPYYKED